MRPPALVTAAVLALLAPALPASALHPAESPGSAAPAAKHAAAAKPKAPALRVRTRIGGLNHPWDVKQLPSGSLLVTEREPARLSLSKPGGGRSTVRFPTGKVWVSGETGLMGLEVDPNFTKNRRFYTCSGWKSGGGHDVRVNAWKLNRAEKKAKLIKPLLAGFPTSSGRHGGCRLLIASDGSLLVGTGDAAIGTNPRNKRSLGGKTLRLQRFSGKPWPTNPFIRSDHRRQRYVLTFGHRNVQGLAQRKDGSLWSVEHGSFRDDEVNRLVKRGDYGWNPVPGYNENVPMTDQGLPGKQQAARWRSGSTTVATSGATFVYGKKWGAYNGALAVAVLKDEKLLMMKFGPQGFGPKVTAPAALNGDYGRLRTATLLANGNLLVTTDDEGGRGKVLLVRPR